jgi:hypothetical protein
MSSERPASRMEIIEALAEIAKQSFADELTKVVRSCLNCDHFDEPSELCKKYGGRPPAKIIAFGCNGYDEKVPF